MPLALTAKTTPLTEKQLPASQRNQLLVVIMLFSIFYFVDVTLRASGKLFWYDEILTVSFARFRNLPALWAALRSGVESNPPTFHLLTRAAQAIFGGGLIGTRIPEIIGFWILSLCLFRFVQQRAGLVPGAIAMTVPLLSGAYFYAYEARPLGIVMACAAIMLVCWDEANRASRRSRRGWVVGFGSTLLFALAMHCYALLIIIPFGAAEVLRAAGRRLIAWDIWLAMIIPGALAGALYLPLLQLFSSYTAHSDFLALNPTKWIAISDFYLAMLQDSPAVFTLLLVLLALNHLVSNRANESPGTVHFSSYDGVVCLGFIAIPVIGVCLARILHTTSFPRYFLSAMIALSVLIGLGFGPNRITADRKPQWPGGEWIARSALLLIAVALLVGFGRMLRHRSQGIPEQNAVTVFTDQSLLSTLQSGEPVAVLNMCDFLFLVYYRPEWRMRLYPVDRTPRGSHYYTMQQFRPWSPVPYEPPETDREFLQKRKDAYIYGEISQADELQRVTQWATITDFRSDGIHFLARVTRRTE